MDPVRSNLPDHVEAMEAADSGRRLAPAIYRDLLASSAIPVDQDTIEDSDLREAIEDRLLAGRAEFINAMRIADLAKDHAVHVALGTFVNQLDDLRSVLGERWSS